MKFSQFVQIVLLCWGISSFQFCKTKRLTGKDFDSLSQEYVHSIRIKEGKFNRLVISDVYADRIFLVSSLTPSMNNIVLEAKRLANKKNPNRYCYELEIQSLKKGNYLLRTTACYWVGELQLIIF